MDRSIHLSIDSLIDQLIDRKWIGYIPISDLVID